MKKFITLNSVAATLFAASGLLVPDANAGICPPIGLEEDCGAVISVGPGGALTIVNTNGTNYGSGTIDSNPYDGIDDALVGVINNSGGTLNSLHLVGVGDAGGIFAFDDDGQQTFPSGVAFVPPAPFTHTGYEGPNIAFTNIGAGGTNGDIVFIGGLAAGATRWFSLEGAPSTLAIASSLGPSFIVDLDSKKVTDLGTLGGETQAFGINDAGRVVGRSETSTGVGHAFITGPNGVGMTDLGTLGGADSTARGINDAGQVVGSSDTTVSGQNHAFITGPNGAGGMTDLGTLGGSDSVAFAINDAGQVAGYSSTAKNGFRHAFITGPDGVGMTDLGTFGGASSTATGINDAGQVVGFYSGPSVGTHTFITGPNGVGMTDLGVATLGTGINDAGQAVGSHLSHAFITGPDGVGIMDLGTLGGSHSIANGINDVGRQVVGSSETDSTDIGQIHAFITGPDGSGMTDLNSMVTPPTGVTFHRATAINNHGQLAVQGSVVPEPETYAMLLLGLGLIGFLARGRATA